MKAKRQDRWRQGFTLVETLAAAAIVAILLGVSAVGVVYFARWLKITELDNAAREIYLAAENRAVLLSGSGRLETLVKDDAKSVTVKLSAGSDDPETALGYYIYHKGGEEAADLLPDGTIDPALMEGSFYIVYEPVGGSVTDVFYVENETYDVESFQTFYDEVSASAKSVRMQMKPMVGYYGGGTAENAKDNALGTPNVIIKNEETLTVEISYAVLPSMKDKAKLTVILDYKGCEIDITPSEVLGEEKDGRVRFSCTILLDSLKEGEHFSDLFKNANVDPLNKPRSFGGDFTVTAMLEAEGATPSKDSDTDNSLFAEGSDEETAYIANLRHLQNLNKSTSKVDGKTKAEQTADIDCAAYLGENYSFVPIENAELKSYTVQTPEAAEGEDAAEPENYIIRNLNVTEESSSSKKGAGLFAGADGKTITGVRLVNARVDGGNLPAGALAGHAQNAEFDGCRVYWEQESGSLRDVLGDNKNGYNYQITSKGIAGGLAGQMDGGTVKNCLAATLVNGENLTGGLVGEAKGAVDITGSYADCYLSGKTVGGLAGRAGTLKLENCYAAGFIEIEDKAGVSAAGLCTSGTVTGKSVYSVMHCPDTEKAVWKPLAPNVTGTDFYYLSSEMSSELDPRAKTYKEMVSKEFAKTMGEAFDDKDQDSHPYNLRVELALTVYEFPGLSLLPHYGDWNTQFVDPSLVYYEQYSESGCGFYGGGVDALQDVKPIKDGYGIAFRSEGLLEDSLTVTIDGKNYEYKKSELHSVTGTDGTEYLLAPLPDEMVDVKSAKEEFYLPFIFETGGETYEYYYCPHFAKTAIKTKEPPPAPAGISVRTPRHLYMLSEHKEYYNKTRVFYQELDLDYSIYKGYNLFPANFTQVPIGRVDEPFNGVYDGGCHTIKNLVFQTLKGTTRAYAGLFGYSSGTLRNVVYLMDAERQNAVSLGSHGSLYIGGLAGGSAGTIFNCAAAGVNLKGMAYTATIYVGGLVGQNQGTIDSCGAECAGLTAETSSYAYAYIGGLVGQNRGSGMITTSYAVGRASADADRISKARVCGFVGYNQGSILDSYAAMDLMSSGKAVETYGFCGVTYGSQNGTYFLNIGNFTYRGTPYNASYNTGKAKDIIYSALTGQPSSPVAGMSYVVPAGGGEGGVTADSFPYPTAVKDAAGAPVHYGQWPKQMQLGIMGVYYWEELSIGIEDTEPTYHISLMAVNTEEVPKTITKLSTLSTAHSDNGVVTDYGYGYYYTDLSNDGISVALTADSIYYSLKGAKGTAFNPANDNVEDDRNINNKLAELMPGYTFHSYHSFGMEEDGGGLYPTGSPNGMFTLKRTVDGKTDAEVKFVVNPHFADALSVESAAGWKLVNASTDAPGSKAGNPYEVRAVSQLQNINWNKSSCDTDTVIEGSTNSSQFPYLSTSDKTGKYYWLQTHDLNGKGKTQTPIAEYHDETGGKTGNLYCWFGGTYDGDGYVIENVNIQGQKSSCTGLFGIVYNGVLRDVILYSSDGKGTVTSGHNTGTQSRWYSIGALAAVAASDNDNALQNCAVAGYKIVANSYVYAAGTGDAWGGVEVGGLVGISNMALENCSANTTIYIPGTARSGNDNMRIGGLVGAGLKTITNCYAGGEIIVDPKTTVAGYPNFTAAGIYIGGIIGGSYFKPLTPNGGKEIGPTAVNQTNNALTNCYSYVTLPKYNANDRIKGLCVLGGTGEINQTTVTGDAANHGTCTITNCYYLESIEPDLSQAPKMGNSNKNSPAFRSDVKSFNTIGMNYAKLDLTALTYAQLSGQEGCDRLNKGQNDAPWEPVTSRTDDGYLIPGKYSYPSEAHLRGLNYPFPTILMRENVYHVHYGNWPLNGIKRAAGGEPIEIDLFTKPSHTEIIGAQLTLEGMGGGNGRWNAETQHKEIAAAEIKDNELIVTGKSVGVTTLTLTYIENGVTSTLALSVNVTAQLELRATGSKEGATVRLFTNDTVDVKLSAYGSNVNPQDLENPLDLEKLGVTVKAAVGTFDSAMLDTVEVDKDLILHLTTGGTAGGATVSLNYTYVYKDVEYTGISAVTFQIVEPEIKPEEDGTTSLIFEGGEIAGAEVTEGDFGEGKLSFSPGGNTVSLNIEGVPAGEITVEVTLTMDGRKHVVAVKVTSEGPTTEPDESGEGEQNQNTNGQDPLEGPDGEQTESPTPTPTPDITDPTPGADEPGNVDQTETTPPETGEPSGEPSTAVNSEPPTAEPAAVPEQTSKQDDPGEEDQTE